MILAWVEASDLEQADSPLAESAALSASRIMWSLTGRRYSGQRTFTEIYRPNGTRCFSVMEVGRLAAGIATVSEDKPYRTGPRGELFIPLNGRPVRSITSVTAPVGASIIDPDSYWIVNKAYLALSIGVPVQDGIEVEYIAGSAIPAGGLEAAKALADELILLFNNADTCRLKNVTSISRQGMTIEVEDAKSILVDGRTGIPEVDLFVASLNPSKSKTPARVFSPDAYKRITRTR